ncbi:hypothetical protein BJY00DRAFT_315540 [Aspergillus carlsbadensis]|nr:hypothetical protein BJY00DRAFT_315540 [Aspergillus carlsbadensis]
MPSAQASIMNPLGECINLTKFKLIPENVLIPTHLDQIIPDDLRLDLNFLRINAGRAFRTMIIIVRRRENRYRALCPPTESKYKRHTHSATISRLKRWREDYDTYDPTLAPSPKIPGPAIYLNISQTAYEKWSESYASQLLEFKNGPYKQYHESAEDFLAAIRVARDKRKVSHLDYHELIMFYRTFMREMTIWEDVISRLDLPRFSEIVNELYEAVVERVENGERMYPFFQKVRDKMKEAGRDD